MNSKNKYWTYTSLIIIMIVFAASAAYSDDAKSSRISKPVRDLNQSPISKATAKDFKAEPAPKYIPQKTDIPKSQEPFSGDANIPKASAQKFELQPPVKYSKPEGETGPRNAIVKKTKQQAPFKRLEPKSSTPRVTQEKSGKKVDSKPATYRLVPQAEQKSIPQEQVTTKSGASESTSKTLDNLGRINRDAGKTESVTGKLTNIGQENKDLSQLRDMFEQGPGGSRFTDPTGESLMDEAGQTGPPRPGMHGLIEERDFLTNPAKRQEGRDSLGESFGLSTANPKDDMFNNQLGSLTGTGDSRLSADEGPKPEDPKPEDPPAPEPDDPKPKDDGSDDDVLTYDLDPYGTTGLGITVRVRDASDSQNPSGAQTTIGNIWKGLVNAVGGNDSDDDSGGNVAVGIRGTPVPDQDYSRGALSAEDKAAILQREKDKTGAGGDDFEPGASRSSDPTQLKENANRLAGGVNPTDPYARPTDDSNGGSSDSDGFGNSIPEVAPQETVKHQLEPELETGRPGSQIGTGGEIPRN